MQDWFLYIIQCKNGGFYTGVTTDLQRRFQEHKEKRGGRYTRLSKVEKLVYSEKYSNIETALKRERQIKGWRKKKKENLIKYGFPNSPT